MTRTESAFLPPKASRLWLGIAIAIVGPILMTPLVRMGSLSVIPGVPFVLVIVVAALVGRLVAAGIAIAVSTVLLDRYVISAATGSGARTEQDVWAVVVLVTVSLVLNLITPSAGERAIWAPILLILLASSAVVAIKGSFERFA